ncbi:UDP-GlcNAc: peptide-N-acetylglucosaminyltransferase [Gracilaria domingensis]|nr:UDP-GlcNAc: peptide-N-acetylglucosaminyltransferase [Gracilaria domingensis]
MAVTLHFAPRLPLPHQLRSRSRLAAPPHPSSSPPAFSVARPVMPAQSHNPFYPPAPAVNPPMHPSLHFHDAQPPFAPMHPVDTRVPPQQDPHLLQHEQPHPPSELYPHSLMLADSSYPHVHPHHQLAVSQRPLQAPPLPQPHPSQQHVQYFEDNNFSSVPGSHTMVDNSQQHVMHVPPFDREHAHLSASHVNNVHASNAHHIHPHFQHHQPKSDAQPLHYLSHPAHSTISSTPLQIPNPQLHKPQQPKQLQPKLPNMPYQMSDRPHIQPHVQEEPSANLSFINTLRPPDSFQPDTHSVLQPQFQAPPPASLQHGAPDDHTSQELLFPNSFVTNSSTHPQPSPNMFAVPSFRISSTDQYVPQQTGQDNLAAPPQAFSTIPLQPTALLLAPAQQPLGQTSAQPLDPSQDLTMQQIVPNAQVPAAPTIPMQDMLAPLQFTVPVDTLESCLAVGRACQSAGYLNLASDVYRACIILCPESAEARAAFTSAMYSQGIYDPNLSEFTGLEFGHVPAEDIFNNVGNTLRNFNRIPEAEMAYRAALSISPRHPDAWNNLGNAMRARVAIFDAMHCYNAALACHPGFPAAHCNLAGLLRDQGKPQEAESHYRAALMGNPNLPEAAAGLGTALRDMGRTDEAIPFYIRAVTLQPDAADHHANLANTYKDLNKIEESVASYKAALSLQPDLPDAFCNMVHSLSVICDWSDRTQNFATLLAIIDKQLVAMMRNPGTPSRLQHTLMGALSNSTPQLVDACGSRSEREGSLSTSTLKEENSDRLARRKYVHHPSSPAVFRKSKLKSRFAKFITSSPSVVSPVLITGLPSVQPFHALIYPLSPEKFKALSAAYASRAESVVAGIPHVLQHWVYPRGPKPRLKVGYVSSDYNNHPYSHLTQSIYGLHGKGTSVECYCYALTPSDNSHWRRRIENEAEHFLDISGLSAKQSAEAIANDGIHVLVNCNGYTKGARTELFALRPAPIQVSFMGFPGTLGAHYIEYFITDVVTSPPSLASRMHSEALLYHPHSYFVNDHKQTSYPGPNAYPSGRLTRARYGLPEDCFLFLMHNQLYKLSPDTFDVWARILKRVPNSKIWLLRFPPTAEQRIRNEALARGLGPDRLFFTDVAGKEEHVARAGLGDLFLDTPTCNAHTTGTDVLWSGVPMITCPGSLFASRVAASLLTAAGFPELVAPDMNAYEDLAVELATNRPRLAAIRAKLEASRYNNALFDTERWVRNVEGLYWQAWRNYERGNTPTHIYGRDVYDGSTMVTRPVAVEGMHTGASSSRSETMLRERMYNPALVA